MKRPGRFSEVSICKTDSKEFDFTYVYNWSKFVKVACSIDAFARRIDGWKTQNKGHGGLLVRCF